MESYELPEVEGLSPDEASSALDRIHAQAACDPLHPLTNRHHPQSAPMLKAVTALHEVFAQREPAPTVFDVALQEAAEKREARREEARGEVGLLTDLGYAPEEIPEDEDVPPHQLAALKMRRFAAQQDFDSLVPLVEGAICRLAGGADLWAALADFRQAKKARAPDLHKRAERLVKQVASATAKQHAGPSKPGAITETENWEDEE